MLLIWKAFQSKEERCFPFWNIFFRFRDIYVFVLCKWGISDDVIDRSTKTVQHSIKNISGNIKEVFLKLGTRNVHHKRKKWQLSCRCHDNSYAAGPVLIKTKVPNNLMGRVKTNYVETMSVPTKTPCPTQKGCKRDIWFYTERDWNQGCCHGNNIAGVILFLLWCTFLVPSLKITAPIFLEIFLI